MSRHVDRTACALLLVLTACGRGPDVGGGPEAATWSRRLRADAPTRDGALVELRKKREAGVPSVLALLDDPEIARTEGHAAIREELVYILGEGGTTSVEAQRRLERLLADPGSDVGEALAAARGLVLSWRMGREVPILEAYIALLRRVTRAEDARMATSVSALALSGGRFPYEPAYVAALRAGTAHPKSCVETTPLDHAQTAGLLQ